MTKYTAEFFEELQIRLLQEAETLASNIEEDGLTNHMLTIKVEDEFFDFHVDATMYDLYKMPDINAVTYKATVVCTDIPEVKNKRLRDFLKSEIYCETLYRD